MNPEFKKDSNLNFFEEVKAEVYKDGELIGETTLLREPHIQLHWKKVDEELGFMEKIVLPDGQEVLFNEEQNKIDFEPCRPYIGTKCDYHVDGEYRWTKELNAVMPNQDGVNALFFQLDMDAGEDLNTDLQGGENNE